MMYSLIEIASGNEIASTSQLPFNPRPPGKPHGRIATFTQVGQEAGGYKVVDRVTIKRPTAYHIKGVAKVTFDGEKATHDPGWTLPSVNELALRVKGQIKARAGTLIVDKYPEWKQRNMTAEGAALLKMLVVNGSWASKEQARVDALEAAWAAIGAVRTHSDSLEAEIDAISKGAGTEAEKAQAIAVWSDHDWPEI